MVKVHEVRWKDNKANEEVLKVVREERLIISTIRKRKKNWIDDHNIKRTPGLMNSVTEGRMEGKIPRGIRRIGMFDDLKDMRSYTCS